MLWAPVPSVANEPAAEEEAAPAHGDSRGQSESEAKAPSAEDAKSEEAGRRGPTAARTHARGGGEAAVRARAHAAGRSRTRSHKGVRARIEFQKRFLAELNTEMRKMPPEVWDDPRNARAAVIFVLSGGDPRLANDLSGPHAAAAGRRAAAQGARSPSARGGRRTRCSSSKSIDVRSLEPGLAGLVALIHGTLIAKKEAKKAIALFDDARLLSPGTLVEELALRQEVLLVAREGDFERFDRLSSQYSRRFGKSIYARNFRRQFFAGVARQDFNGTSEWISRTETELMKLPQAERGGAYLSIAEEATLAGNVAIASFAAGKAAELAREGSAEKERAQLYRGRCASRQRRLRRRIEDAQRCREAEAASRRQGNS